MRFGMNKKPVVWYVYDLPSNLEKFKEKHSEAFTIETFSRPERVLESLEKSRPDALLCDIFFYENGEIAEEMETKVWEKAKELSKFGEFIGANKLTNQDGIKLIETVSRRFGTRFPIYAYTSKGPYLLDQIGFDRIGDAGAKWLFKKKYGMATEQFIIKQDVEEFRFKNSITI